MVVASVFALVVAGAGIGILVLFLSGRAVAADVTTEPVLTAGGNPFMPSVGMDRTDVVPPPTAAGNFPGDTPGLYGGTRNVATCDPAAMVAFLSANPDKAAAWAGVLGIDPAGIPAYVAELTPVVVRSDVYVTNHGFSGGRATAFTAILQAGTAVLVDRFGVPRVKCYCGNPLTPAVVPKAPRFLGPAWPGFSSTKVTVIQQSTTVIQNITIVDPVTNEVFDRPIGSTGSADRLVSGLPTSGPPTTPPGPTTGPLTPPRATVVAPTVGPRGPAQVSGSHVLTQSDGPNCDFADAPRIEGTITFTIGPDGTASGTMAGRGSGTRDIECNGTSARMYWSQDYTVRFTGQVSGGRLSARGTLDNVNRTRLEGCVFDGHTTSCPNYQAGPGTLGISLTGTIDPATGRGNGTFTVDVARPTSGTWRVS